MHPANNDAHFQVNFSIDSGSNYNVTKTTAYFRAQAQKMALDKFHILTI